MRCPRSEVSGARCRFSGDHHNSTAVPKFHGCLAGRRVGLSRTETSRSLARHAHTRSVGRPEVCHDDAEPYLLEHHVRCRHLPIVPRPREQQHPIVGAQRRARRAPQHDGAVQRELLTAGLTQSRAGVRIRRARDSGHQRRCRPEDSSGSIRRSVASRHPTRRPPCAYFIARLTPHVYLLAITGLGRIKGSGMAPRPTKADGEK